MAGHVCGDGGGLEDRVAALADAGVGPRPLPSAPRLPPCPSPSPQLCGGGVAMCGRGKRGKRLWSRGRRDGRPGQAAGTGQAVTGGRLRGARGVAVEPSTVVSCRVGSGLPGGETASAAGVRECPRGAPSQTGEDALAPARRRRPPAVNPAHARTARRVARSQPSFALLGPRLGLNRQKRMGALSPSAEKDEALALAGLPRRVTRTPSV